MTERDRQGDCVEGHYLRSMQVIGGEIRGDVPVLPSCNEHPVVSAEHGVHSLLPGSDGLSIPSAEVGVDEHDVLDFPLNSEVHFDEDVDYLSFDFGDG